MSRQQSVELVLLKFRKGMPLYHATYLNTPEIRSYATEEHPEILPVLEQLPEGAPLDDRDHGKYMSLLPELGIEYGGHSTGMTPLKYKTKKEMVIVDLELKNTEYSKQVWEWVFACGLDEKIDGFIAHEDILREVYLFRPYEVLDDAPALRYASQSDINRLMKAGGSGLYTYDQMERMQLEKWLKDCDVFNISMPPDCARKEPRHKSCASSRILKPKWDTVKEYKGEHVQLNWKHLRKYKRGRTRH